MARLRLTYNSDVPQEETATAPSSNNQAQKLALAKGKKGKPVVAPVAAASKSNKKAAKPSSSDESSSEEESESEEESDEESEKEAAKPAVRSGGEGGGGFSDFCCANRVR